MLHELALNLRSSLLDTDVKVDEAKLSKIFDILTKECQATDLVHFSKIGFFKSTKAKKNIQDLDLSDEFVVDFVKALGGALLCIIPHPITYAIGGALVADGLKDMAIYAKDAPPPDEHQDHLETLL